MPRIAEIEFTPNPNARKFILRDPLTYGVSKSYESAEQAKGDVWSAIQAADPAHADVALDLVVDPTTAPPPPAAQTYSVRSGDTLSKISKQFYGDANKYMKIFDANRDTLSDPDKIKPGQVLKIPAA